MSDTLSEQEVRDRYRRLQAKVREYRQEAARCREIARLMVEARGTRAALCGVYPDKTSAGGILAFLCAPGLDESKLGAVLLPMVREFWDGVARSSGGKIPSAADAGLHERAGARVTGTMADKDTDDE